MKAKSHLMLEVAKFGNPTNPALGWSSPPSSLPLRLGWHPWASSKLLSRATGITSERGVLNRCRTGPQKPLQWSRIVSKSDTTIELAKDWFAFLENHMCLPANELI